MCLSVYVVDLNIVLKVNIKNAQSKTYQDRCFNADKTNSRCRTKSYITILAPEITKIIYKWYILNLFSVIKVDMFPRGFLHQCRF